MNYKVTFVLFIFNFSCIQHLTWCACILYVCILKESPLEMEPLHVTTKAGVPLTDYNRIRGSAVGGLIEWNLFRLFSTDRFDPTAWSLDQSISQWQSKITSERSD